MTLNWTLLLDADMSQTDVWQLSGVTDAEILRIEQENPPEIGRFALAQVSPDGAEFLQTNAYPARAESTRINLEYVGFSQKLIAVRYRYAEISEGALPWRIKVYGSKSGYQPPINPSAIVLTLDPRIAGAIPLEEKGIAEGVAELDESGIVPLDQLPPWGDLIGANLAATEALAIQIESLSAPTLAELGGEPVGAETRANAYTDLKISEIPPPTAPTLAELGGEPVGAESRAKAYTDLKISEIPPPTAPTLAELGGEPVGAESRAKTYADSLLPALIARLDKLESDYPVSLNHFWGTGNPYNGATQKSWTKSNSSNNDFSRFAAVASSAQNDTVDFKFPLKAGSYTLEITHLKRPGDGIASIYIDDILIGTIDAYNGTTTNVNRYTVTFTVSLTDLHTFKCIIASKNSSSSGFAFACSAVLIYSSPVLPPVNLVLINCGDQQSYTANDGRVWSADQYFSGGVRTDIEAALGQTVAIQNTQNPRLYKFERALDSGTFTYSIPIGQAGTFTVKLLFCENYHSSAGQRVGSVAINGVNYLSNFDIFAETGKHTALVKAWNNVVMPSSTVTIAITNTLINGIELVRFS